VAIRVPVARVDDKAGGIDLVVDTATRNVVGVVTFNNRARVLLISVSNGGRSVATTRTAFATEQQVIFAQSFSPDNFTVRMT
jgi:hypothetical protein